MPLINQTFSQLITFTRASSATYVDARGLIQSASTNVPRFDYNPSTLAPRGILIEEQRTNLLTYSEQFDNAAWTKSGGGTGSAPVVTANAAIAPDGSQTAELVVFNRGAGNASADQSILSQASIPTTISANYAGSFYVKAATASDIGKQLAFRHVVAAGYLVITLTADWQRITRTEAAGGVSSSFDIANRGTFTADNTVSAHLWGAQLEAGAFSTSYIPTVASQVTRAADVASVNNLSPWYNMNEGTLFAESNRIGTAMTSAMITDGSLNNFVGLYTNSSGVSQGAVSSGGVSQAGFNSGATSVGTPYKVALAFKANDFAYSFNGAAALTDTSGSIPVVNVLGLGQFTNGSGYGNGHIRRIVFYPSRLSNANLQTITA